MNTKVLLTTIFLALAIVIPSHAKAETNPIKVLIIGDESGTAVGSTIDKMDESSKADFVYYTQRGSSVSDWNKNELWHLSIDNNEPQVVIVFLGEKEASKNVNELLLKESFDQFVVSLQKEGRRVVWIRPSTSKKQKSLHAVNEAIASTGAIYFDTDELVGRSIDEPTPINHKLLAQQIIKAIDL